MCTLCVHYVCEHAQICVCVCVCVPVHAYMSVYGCVCPMHARVYVCVLQAVLLVEGQLQLWCSPGAQTRTSTAQC